MGSNSDLVSYSKLSPNYSTRTAKIDRITIHHMAGIGSVESCGEIFASPARQASANYGIGNDGRVGLYVPEDKRAWTTSNRLNDNRAVTIEVSNSAVGDPWPISEAAYKSLIELCVDICHRNGIERLNYTGDATGNLTMHCWFASTACPGPYLKARFPQIAEEVNSRLNGSKNAAVVKLSLTEDPDKEIWDFFIDKGLSSIAAAGVMANLYAESGLKSTNLENTYERLLGMSDESYTAAVDNGSYTRFVHDAAGYGLAQWTWWSRKQNLLNFAKSSGTSIGDRDMQLEFLWKEMQGYPSMMKKLANAATVREASDAVLLDFERPRDQSEQMCQTRARYAQMFYDKYRKEEDEMSLDQFKMMWTEMIKERQDNDASPYSAEAREWAVQNEIVVGGSTNDFNGMWEDYLTREQMVTMMYRLAKKIGIA